MNDQIFTCFKPAQQFIVDRLLKQADLCEVTGDSSGLVAELQHLEEFGIQIAQA